MYLALLLIVKIVPEPGGNSGYFTEVKTSKTLFKGVILDTPDVSYGEVLHCLLMQVKVICKVFIEAEIILFCVYADFRII